MELYRKIDQIKRKYCEDNRYTKNKLSVSILFECHRCFKGFLETEPYLKTLINNYAKSKNAKVLDKQIGLYFQKTVAFEQQQKKQPNRYAVPNSLMKEIKIHEPKTKKTYARRKTN